MGGSFSVVVIGLAVTCFISVDILVISILFISGFFIFKSKLVVIGWFKLIFTGFISVVMLFSFVNEALESIFSIL